MDITFTSIREGFEKLSGYLIEEASNAAQNIVQLGQSACTQAAPYLQSALEKIQSINVVELLKSNTAKSCGLLAVAIACTAISRQIDHTLGKGIFVVASIVAAVFAGIFLLNPALLEPIAGLI
jgi:hypothetical protein